MTVKITIKSKIRAKSNRNQCSNRRRLPRDSCRRRRREVGRTSQPHCRRPATGWPNFESRSLRPPSRTRERVRTS